MEFLVDPGEEGDGRVFEGVTDCLGFGGLEFVVGHAVFVDMGCAC